MCSRISLFDYLFNWLLAPEGGWNELRDLRTQFYEAFEANRDSIFMPSPLLILSDYITSISQIDSYNFVTDEESQWIYIQDARSFLLLNLDEVGLEVNPEIADVVSENKRKLDPFLLE